MGMMTRMRDNAHVFIIAFAVVFIAFWVFSDVDVGSALRGSANEIGEINGKKITYQEFTAVVDQVIEQQKKQNKTQELDENALASIREQVWNDYVTQAVIDKAVKELNIEVTDKEITDWVRSDNPPEVIARYFKDSTGKFNKEQYRQFLTNPGTENEQALVQIETQLRSDLVRQKLTSMLGASIQVGEGELRDQFMSQNLQYNAKYVLFDAMKYAGADTATPTDKEFEDYYNEHTHEFKTDEMVKLQFVSFLETPSAEDSATIMKELETVAKEAREGKDFMQLLKDYSEQPYQESWTTRQQASAEMVQLVFTQSIGAVIGPIHDQTGLSVIKMLETRQGNEPLTQAKHILIRSKGSDDETKKQAQSILDRVKKGESFETLAQQYSDDKSSGARGGDLGWFGKGRMVKPFEEAALNGKVGSLVGPVKTDFGYHIIKIENRNALEVKYAAIKMSIRASGRTKEDAFERARNFAYFSNENGFEKETMTNKYQIHETGEFAKQRGSYIPEIGVNPSLLKFAFEEKIGLISEVHKSSTGYVVARITEKIPAGYRPLNQVRQQIVEPVKMERRMKKIAEIAQGYYAKMQPSKGLESLLPPDSSLKVVTTGPYTMAQGIPVIGRDNMMLGRIASLQARQISKPFRCLRGYAIVQLVSKGTFDSTAYKVQRDNLRQQAAQQKQNEFIQAWLEKMKEKITIVDNRDRFFR